MPSRDDIAKQIVDSGASDLNSLEMRMPRVIDMQLAWQRIKADEKRLTQLESEIASKGQELSSLRSNVTKQRLMVATELANIEVRSTADTGGGRR